ncbi:hypothetical protein [Bifidobacterium adolescentis]|jgi:hypothetical protein|uniref:hypothetical protein n=1 Tax=Bifidobacterium adolescentis TaxID=1680 RepID=UPI001896E14A|nr:hypothetical protein [Bifidobacterium adolescentis]MBV3434561.1 hypothetical protein [Bifidobacterium adolescentis]MDB1502788.1 hypothetical protein [Bifidobacterium adolescentis]
MVQAVRQLTDGARPLERVRGDRHSPDIRAGGHDEDGRRLVQSDDRQPARPARQPHVRPSENSFFWDSGYNGVAQDGNLSVQDHKLVEHAPQQ